jgi:hypothetical protein
MFIGRTGSTRLYTPRRLAAFCIRGREAGNRTPLVELMRLPRKPHTHVVPVLVTQTGSELEGCPHDYVQLRDLLSPTHNLILLDITHKVPR